tara:strand:- start:44 stop:271 length:228 start_codon:yes stop_codon:yes gene_type:complete
MITAISLKLFAVLVELADTLALGASVAIHGGSSPSYRTRKLTKLDNLVAQGVANRDICCTLKLNKEDKLRKLVCC